MKIFNAFPEYLESGTYKRQVAFSITDVMLLLVEIQFALSRIRNHDKKKMILQKIEIICKM